MQYEIDSFDHIKVLKNIYIQIYISKLKTNDKVGENICRDQPKNLYAYVYNPWTQTIEW